MNTQHGEPMGFIVTCRDCKHDFLSRDGTNLCKECTWREAENKAAGLLGPEFAKLFTAGRRT